MYVPSHASPEAFPGIVYEATIDQVRGAVLLSCAQVGIITRLSNIIAVVFKILRVFIIDDFEES
jgi:hypothetical protein